MNEEGRRDLLIAELEPCMQVFVACGIALDDVAETLRLLGGYAEQLRADARCAR
ncbi:MAG TPA: hypothetical protein VFA81_07175 [Burkholderiales bacterium]|nr:hypothetical protein [Burkholderiales bacterium]